MSSLAEMRNELRELRKSHPEHKPVSKMRKADISSMIQKLKVNREETPDVAYASSNSAKMYKSASESIKKAKAEEFPLAHHSEMPSKPAPKPKAKKEMPVAKAKAEKTVMVSERGDTAAKKPKGKMAQE